MSHDHDTRRAFTRRIMKMTDDEFENFVRRVAIAMIERLAKRSAQ